MDISRSLAPGRNSFSWSVPGGLIVILAALRPELGLLAAIFALLALLAVKDEYLLLGILIFGVISSMPKLGVLGGLIEIPLTGTTAINFFGVLRTALAALTTVRVGMLIYEDWRLVRLNRMFLYLSAYALLSLAWVQRDAVGESMRRLVHLLLSLGTFYLAAAVGTRKDRAIRFLREVGALAVILSAGSLFAMKFVAESNEAGLNESLLRDSRLVGIMSSPNALAGSLAVFIAISAALLSCSTLPRRLRTLSWVVVVLSTTALTLTLSRSGWIGALLAILMMLLMRRRWGVLLSIGCLGLILLAVSAVGQKFLGDWRSILQGADLAEAQGYQNAYGRVAELWRPAIEQLVTPRSIWVGRGVGTTQYWAAPSIYKGLHSEFLEIWLDLGSIGAGILLLGFWTMVQRSLRLFARSRDPIGKAHGVAAIGAILAMVPRFVWDFVFNGLPGMLLFATCGLALGATRWALGPGKGIAQG
jgi:O-antigen ligase